MARIPIGLQLYTLREDTERDMAGTLRRVAALGYESVEFAGYGGLPAPQLRAVLAEAGLTAVSAHVPYDRLLNQLEEELFYAKELGLSYLIFPWVEADRIRSEAGLDELIGNLIAIGEQIRKAGLGFCYHNHEFELETVGGELILDRIYRKTDPALLQAELDLFWLKKAGIDPKHYLLSYTGRVRIVHLKDMEAGDEGFFAEVGHGIMDIPALLEAAAEAGVKHLLVEQDICRRSPWESIELSIGYLRQLGAAKPLA
ncbi:sugar phosphate isomerase/epimerase family protein [Gorillibacterium sp. sgz500922]|uniref:sugar phosphate isomerase/epimerase family protein n=1 Tax=Gorillibacterium sp. sgz500922 TaxID=3446694 RepID=UPI003F671485